MNSTPKKKVLIGYADLWDRGHTHCRMHLRRKVADPSDPFPAPVQLGPNTIAWFLDEVEAYEQLLREERDARITAEKLAALRSDAPPPAKRPPGRPRKHPLPLTSTTAPPDPAPAPMNCSPARRR